MEPAKSKKGKGAGPIVKHDDPRRWWFLTAKGYQAFERDPVAQGYEIICRHPGFPHLVCSRRSDREKGELLKAGLSGDQAEYATVWDFSDMESPRPSWSQLSLRARQAFLFEYKFDLLRMGFIEVIWAGARNLTFNCRESSKSIEDGIRFWLERSGLFKPFPGPRDKREKTRTSHNLLRFIGPAHGGNPEMVTVDWAGLIALRREDTYFRWSEHVSSAVKTLMEHDPKFLAYKEGVKETSHSAPENRSPRPRRPDPETTAMLCVCSDWVRSGRSGSSLKRTPPQIVSDFVRGTGVSDTRNYLRRIAALHSRVNLKIVTS